MPGRNLNWNDIRPINNSLNDGFEELVCQLARIENIDKVRSFIRKGKPDAGVECFYILESGEEIAWQAKFFTNSFESSQWNQIDKSVIDMSFDEDIHQHIQLRDIIDNQSVQPDYHSVSSLSLRT